MGNIYINKGYDGYDGTLGTMGTMGTMETKGVFDRTQQIMIVPCIVP